MVRFCFIMALLFISSGIRAQEWMDGLLHSNARTGSQPGLREYENAFNEYWKTRSERKKGYKPYRRVFHAGEDYAGVKTPAYDRLSYYLERDAQRQSMRTDNFTGNWNQLGPVTIPVSGTGVGRLNRMTFHPTDSNIIWVCSPSGGIWKTTDGGQTWEPKGDNLPVMGAGNIVINPLHPDTMYLSTGDNDLINIYTLGIMKSVDGGETWTFKGPGFNLEVYEILDQIFDLVMDPTNPEVLYCTSRQSIFKTTNGGDSWVKSANIAFVRDLEFKPGTPTTLYGATRNGEIYRTTTAGSFGSWTKLNPGFTSSQVSRINLEVTPADPEAVYAFCSNKSEKFFGLYKSGDAGTTWRKVYDSTDLVHAQAPFNLAFAVSPIDTNKLQCGGVYCYRSINAGKTWIYNNVNIHVDFHHFKFAPWNPAKLYSCNDGGFFVSNDTGKTWVSLNNGLKIAQFYRLGLNQKNRNTVIAGAQDNGTNLLRQEGFWKHVFGGDGMECSIDPSDTNIVFACSQDGGLARSTNAGQNFFSIKPAGEIGSWVTPHIIQPHTTPHRLYAGYKELYVRPVTGSTWTKLTTNIGNDNRLCGAIATAPSDSNRIYASWDDKNNGPAVSVFYRSLNGGASWENITANVGLFGTGSSKNISYIAVDETNADRLWLSISDVSGAKVMYSANGGINWTDISANLPTMFPARCIVKQSGPGDGLYVGTDVGIYYRNATMTEWENFDFGLPNVAVYELEIQEEAGIIMAATFGRGIWQSDLKTPPLGNTLQEITVSKTEFKLFPNPGHHTTYIDLHAYKGQKIKWSMSSITGREITGGEAEVNELNFIQEIECMHCGGGVYFITVVAPGSTSTQKLVLK